LDGGLSKASVSQQSGGFVSGRGERASGAGSTDGSHVRPVGGRNAHGEPCFNQPVAPGGYLWWYVDALSDDGRYGLSIIAFVGSVFSPYYAWARARNGGIADPENFCAINVALYGAGGRRWTMTERGRHHIHRAPDRFTIGPSALHWNGQSLVIDIDEINVPIPSRVRGRVTVTPLGLCDFVAGLDAAGKHRWGPIGPCSRIDVAMNQPDVKWSGHAYLDSNEGDEPVNEGFNTWDWSRALMRNGDTAVIYDVRPRFGDQRVIAQRFSTAGKAEPFEAPPRQPLPKSKWLIPRTMRSEAGVAPVVDKTLEDTPFYVRSVMQSGLQSELVTSVHETLDAQRVASLPVRMMLPWRMPRVA
jgi:carotenoid 1,2-hydratase